MTITKRNNNKGIMNRQSIILLLMVLTMQPFKGNAQIGWDVASVEAFIDDHKSERSILTTRSILEQGNKILHSTSDNTNGRYRDMGVELDKYTKAFDAIDIIVNSLSTGFQIYRTVDNISDKVGKYKELLDDFNERIIKRGRLELVDSILLTINRDAIMEVYNECENIYGSVTAIAAYSSGRLLAKTSDINVQILLIDQSLRRIDAIINRSYFQTYTYIKSRIYMWNRAIWTEKSKLTIANDAFSRWRANGKATKVNEPSSKKRQ